MKSGILGLISLILMFHFWTYPFSTKKDKSNISKENTSPLNQPQTLVSTQYNNVNMMTREEIEYCRNLTGALNRQVSQLEASDTEIKLLRLKISQANLTYRQNIKDIHETTQQTLKMQRDAKELANKTIRKWNESLLPRKTLIRAYNTNRIKYKSKCYWKIKSHNNYILGAVLD